MPALPAWNRTTTPAAGIAVLLVAGIWAGEVRAGCGDHFVILRKGVSPAEPALPTSPTPCQGPHCSLRREAPAPLLPVSVSVKPLSHEAVLVADPPDDPARNERLWLDHFPPPVGHPADIFHPPRGG